MYFNELTTDYKILYIKKEFANLVKQVFDNPELLKSFVNNKSISNDQSKEILKIFITNKFNSKTCSCCRKFDSSKLELSPIEKELEPLLDIAQTNVKGRSY